MLSHQVVDSDTGATPVHDEGVDTEQAIAIRALQVAGVVIPTGQGLSLQHHFPFLFVKVTFKIWKKSLFNCWLLTEY